MIQNNLYLLFKKYMQMHLINNKHLVDALFFAFCGVVFQIKCIYSAKYIQPRVSVFCIQDSGTGKSQATTALYWLLRDIVPTRRVFMCLKATDAALIGSPDLNRRGNEAEQSRLLFRMLALFWDEGTVLTKQGPYSENLQDILQMALNEPGWIAKALRDGTIEGPTNITVISGSYYDNSIGLQLLNRGFFQRMFVTFKTFTDTEKIETYKRLEQLEIPSYLDKKRVVEEIRNELQELRGGGGVFVYPISVNALREINIKEVRQYLTQKLNSYFKNKVLQQYGNARKQAVFESVWNRVRLMVIKIAVQLAYLNKQDIVSENNIDTAFYYVEKHHINGIKNLLDNITDTKPKILKVEDKDLKALLLKRIAWAEKEFGKKISRPKLLLFLWKINERVEEDLRLPQSRTKTLLLELEKEGKIIIDKGKTPYIISLREGV